MSKKNSTAEPVKEAVQVKEPEKAVETTKVEEEYGMEEFYAASRTLFGVAPEMVKAAFLCNGITKCSKERAAKIIDDFKNKEVK